MPHFAPLSIASIAGEYSNSKFKLINLYCKRRSWKKQLALGTNSRFFRLSRPPKGWQKRKTEKAQGSKILGCINGTGGFHKNIVIFRGPKLPGFN